MLTRLTLTNFRNYQALIWRPLTRVSVLLGPNGAGKTNLLEAISLLVPGRGLRGTRNDQLARHGSEGPWGVAGRFLIDGAEMEVGTGVTPQSPERRVFLRDGSPIKSQDAAASRLAMVWLTPQMDRLFLDGAAGRRAFLDRLVFGLDPQHARQVSAHERAVASRNRLFAQGRFDPSWVTALEDEIARHAVAVTAARLSLVSRLNQALAEGAAGDFPAARMELRCPIAAKLAEGPALAAEAFLRTALKESRKADQASARTSHGAHRADMELSERISGVAAAEASTGQQKSLLVGVVLGQAALIEAARGAPPILLLDEAAAHLDPNRREALSAAIARLRGQVVITGTEVTNLPEWGPDAEFFRVEDGVVSQTRV